MRTLAAAGIIAAAVGLTAFAGSAASQTGNQATASGNQAQAPGVTPGGGLGAVDALGQEVKRPAAPTSAPPRLPDGTIDLGDGIWITAPLTPESGLRGAEELLLPPAKALMASRQRTDDPLGWCLPMGVMRYTPYPFRFIQNYTHKQPTHLYILYETMRTYRQVFMDGRSHPPELDPTWFGHSVGRYEKDTLLIDTVGLNDKFWFVHIPVSESFTRLYRAFQSWHWFSVASSRSLCRTTVQLSVIALPISFQSKYGFSFPSFRTSASWRSFSCFSNRSKTDPATSPAATGAASAT